MKEHRILKRPQLRVYFKKAQELLELDFGRFMNRGFLKIVKLEERLLLKPERPGDKNSRKLLDGGIEFGCRAVEEAPRCGDLVLDIGKLVHQALKILVRF